MKWWFEEYPQVPCHYVPEANDVILLLQCHVRSPPLTQSRSLHASVYTLQEAFKNFMYLPSLATNTTLYEMILEDVTKWDSTLYKTALQHPSVCPDDLLTFEPDDWKACGKVVSIFIDLYLKKVSDRYFLPDQCYVLSADRYRSCFSFIF
jgi:hypothetical protein